MEAAAGQEEETQPRALLPPVAPYWLWREEAAEGGLVALVDLVEGGEELSNTVVAVVAHL